jgi:GTP-binding protein HflX
MKTKDAIKTPSSTNPERVLVLHPANKETLAKAEARLQEAIGLAAAIHLEVVHAEIIVLHQPRPATLIGQGTVDALRGMIAALGVHLVYMDAALSPIQQRNLEKAWACKVIDRTGLILEIFGARARTAEGRLQVELAALTYQRSRLVRSWTHLERQRGNLGFIGGPGETQLEVDKRLITQRIMKIKRELEVVKRTRELHRAARRRVPYPIVALVGYTNAGKSTLFNRLTAANVRAEDLLFATLDPTMRAVRLPSGRLIILSDTVGFISDLPTSLIAAFRATLEEVLAADLIIHVRDISHPETTHQAEEVYKVLRELGLPIDNNREFIEVFNKVDLLENPDSLTSQLSADHLPLSALKGEGLDALLARIEERLSQYHHVVHCTLPASAGAAISWLYAHGHILTQRTHPQDPAIILMTARLSPADIQKFQKRFSDDLLEIHTEY